MPGRHGGGRSRRVDLVGLITRRQDALRVHLVPARDGKVEGVHQARVASRRLREVVPILATGLDDIRLKPLERDLRALTRALGPVRELDVAAGMVDELGLVEGDAQRLRSTWHAHLQHARRSPVRRLRVALAPARRREVDRELAAFATARGASDDRGWREALAHRLGERARDLRHRIHRTGSLYRPEPLHEVRIAAKKLRYVLEITAEARLARLARPLRTLKAAQDSLGRLHDLDVLFMLLHSVPGTAPGEELQHAAAAVVTELERQARRQHARYLRARESLTRVAEFTLDRVVPRVVPTPPSPPVPRHGH